MDNEWLNAQFRLNPDKTKAGLAKALNLGAPAVSKMLAGTRQIKAHEYMAMRQFFGMPAYSGPSARRGSGYVLAPLAQELGEKKTEATEDSWIMPASLLRAHTQAAPEKIRIFTVQENAMAPDFMPGEQVLVDMSDAKPSPPGVFVVSDGLGHIVRQCEYMPHSRPPTVRLSARNNAYEPHILALPKAGIIGRVIAKLQWL
jgi:hypothetical protein